MSRLLLAVLAAALIAPAAAFAQDGVARDGKQTLRAVVKGGDRVCVLLRGRFELGRVCGAAPVSAWRPIRVSNDAAVGRDPYAVALPAFVRSARIGARRVPVVSSAGGRVRLVLQPGGGSGLARFYDRRGRLVGVDPSVGFVGLAKDMLVFGTREDGSSAYAQRVLDPAPGAPDRTRPLACLNNAHGSGGGGGGGGCEEQVTLLPGCSEPDLVAGVLPAGLTALRLSLEDGGEQLVQAVPLPEAYGGAGAAVTLVPVGQAVRGVAALDAAGATMLTGRLDAPPAGQVCDDEDPDGAPIRSETRLRPIGLPQTPVVARAGERTALLSDLPGRGQQSPRVCFGIDRLRGRDCRDAPVDEVPDRIRWTGDALATLLGPQAARVTAVLRTGRRISTAARAPAGYAGPWHGRLRVALLRVPRGSVIERLEVRDRGGRVVGRRRVDRLSKPQPDGGSG